MFFDDLPMYLHMHSGQFTEFHLRVIVIAAIAVAALFFGLTVIADQERAQAMASSESLAAESPFAAEPQGEPVNGDDADNAARPKPVNQKGTLVSAGAPVVAARACEKSTELVRIDRDVNVRSEGGRGRVVGTMPATSKYLGAAMTARVLESSPDGRYGRVVVPWSHPQAKGWIDISRLNRSQTNIRVVADLSERQIDVFRGCRKLFSFPTAIGASQSPSPTGTFFVTDLTRVPPSLPQFGSFAFGLSGIQPNTPPGWTGGNQMAIHGTNYPSSIGTPASAGCLRVSEASLDRLRRLIKPGTPVDIHA
jgi:lipoprotein-anchoring transpeptidase ErfK/SrfK